MGLHLHLLHLYMYLGNILYQIYLMDFFLLSIQVLYNALLLQGLGLDEIAYIKDRGVEVDIKKTFEEFSEDDIDNKE